LSRGSVDGQGLNKYVSSIINSLINSSIKWKR
jgi:hypothetical protein